MKSLKFFAVFLLAMLHLFAQKKVKASKEEWRLYNLINEYRKSNGLEVIPFSSALTYVAQKHCQDMAYKLKTLTHGWSDCPYESSDSKTYPCMWLKPQKLTTYKGYGYECAHGGSGGYVATAESSLMGWKGSKPHNAVITNQGVWKDFKWKAIGVAILEGYACIWFGDEIDSEGPPQE
ncbi:MAG: CAP domain-containing protein [Bacteroidota bacterium]|jgi:hypothetical protein